MPTAKKAPAHKPAAPIVKQLYFLRGQVCDNGDVCHPDPSTTHKTPWTESAEVYGPFRSVEEGMTWMMDNADGAELDDDDVFHIIDGGSIKRYVVANTIPTLVLKAR